MGILVCYDDFTYDVVSDFHLEDMISSGRIAGFDSSSTWVKVEYDPLPETMVNDPHEEWKEIFI
ncbi:MAG: hypothetical protein FD174_2622 [Geobacteraceae bacterium]|nr:MAG: hypothetical protein FD174_2622 [Geobacteraceae bacterium]